MNENEKLTRKPRRAYFVTEIDLASGRHVAYHRVSLPALGAPGGYAQGVAMDAFANGVDNENSGYALHTRRHIL